MAINKKVLGGLVVAALAGSFYFLFGADMIAKYKEREKDIAFDNSKTGMWEVKSVSSFMDNSSLNKEETFNVCITDKMIDDSRVKPLEEKLDVAGLQCEKETKRINKETGEFILTCTGTNPVNNRNVVAKINGKVESNAESGGLEINYSISNGVDAPFEFKIKTESKRVGDCKPEETKK